MAAEVSLVKEKSRRENIFKALQLIEKDLNSFRKAKTVLIKPNFTSAFNPSASTQGEVVEAILEFFEKFDPKFKSKKIILTESSGEAFFRREPMEKVFYRFGFKRVFDKHENVKFWDMNKARSFVSVPIDAISGKTKVRIPKEFFDFDYKISVSIPKTHDTVIFTGGVKNFLMGIIKQEDKDLMHGLVDEKSRPSLLGKILGRLVYKAPWQFLLLGNIYAPNWLKDKIYGFDKKTFIRSVACLHKNLAKVGRLIMPDLVVLDAWWGMDKDGPVYGRRRRLGVAIASVFPVAADVVGAKVIGFKPEKIAYLRFLAKKSDFNPKILGEKIKKVAVKFSPHRHYKYQIHKTP
jgi:uncharacterized protein (DUF362 family)